MLKLLIVDDEQLDREGLRDQMPWEDYGITSVDTAKNGFEALRKIESCMPDIIITDIKMPGMSGIKLIEQVRKLSPEIKVIFVSGHDDFEFAREAIRLDADNYVLKPVDSGELAEAISRIIEDYRHMEQQREDILLMKNMVDKSRNIIREKMFINLIYGTVNEEEIKELKQLSEDLCCARLFSAIMIEFDDFDMPFTEAQEPGIEERLGQADACIMNCRSEAFNAYPVKLDSRRYVILAAFTGELEEELRRAALEAVENLILENIKTYKLRATLAEGAPVEALDKVYKSYETCCSLLLQKPYRGQGTVLRYSESAEDALQSNKVFRRIDQELVKCILNRDENRMCHLIDYMFDGIENMGVQDSRYVQYMCINIISRLEITLYEMNEEFNSMFGYEAYLINKLMSFETITDIRQWMKDTFRTVIDYQNKKAGKINRKIVELVKKYIEENYYKEISLKEISCRLYYSPNHLGLIIKEELGKGFSEYLTEYRMRKACEFLMDPCMKMYEVSERVSYKNVTAFVKKFKELYGITPKEYREGAYR